MTSELVNALMRPNEVGGHGDLMVSTQDSGSNNPGFEPWPGSLCCVLGQDT